MSRDFTVVCDPAPPTRKRLAQWGYTAMDIMNFFTAFSTHGGGVLTLDDFGRSAVRRGGVDGFLGAHRSDTIGLHFPAPWATILVPQAESAVDAHQRAEHKGPVSVVACGHVGRFSRLPCFSVLSGF